MPHSAYPDLLAALSAELVSVRGFVELLQHEQTLLTENRTDQLLALAEKKSSQAVALNQLAESRRTLLANELLTYSGDSVQSWLEIHCKKGLALWHEIRIFAEQAQRLNRINGELIQMKLRHNMQSLTTLSQAVHKADLYGPDGQRSFAPGSGRSLGNV